MIFGRVQTHVDRRSEAGSCNFCTDSVDSVTVIESTSAFRHSVLRLCASCLADLRRALSPL